MKMWLPGLTNRMHNSRSDIVNYWTQRSDVDEFFIAAGYDIEVWTDVPIRDAVCDAIGDTLSMLTQSIEAIFRWTRRHSYLTLTVGLDWGSYHAFFGDGGSGHLWGPAD